MIRIRTCVIVLAAVGCAAVAGAQALSPQQQRLLGEAAASLDQSERLIQKLETETRSLKVGGEGTTLEKTKALLADRDKASQLINTANTRFRQLPLANPDVRAQYDRVKPLRDSLMASDKKLVEVHNELAKGGAQPPPVSAPQAGGAASAPQLGHQQRQSLKDAVYYLDQVEAILGELEARSKDMKVGDAGVRIQDVDTLISNKDRIAQYLTNAENRIRQLPAGHPSVQPEAERAAKLRTSLTALDKKLADLKSGLLKIVQQGGGSEYRADFARLREISQMYANPNVIQGQPEVAVDTIRQMGPVKVERQRIAAKFADLLQQTTAEARDMNSVLSHFDEVFGKFEQTLNQFVSNAPAGIDADIEEALKMGRDAVENKRHMYFGENGGVSQRLGWAKTKLTILEAAAPGSPQTAAARRKFDSAGKEVKSMQMSLLEAIVQSNQPPNETYTGPDKAQLIARVKTKWAESGVSAPVLKMGINSQNWRRDTGWEWRTSAWHKVDISRIQGFVIVKLDDNLAGVHYINLVKDHLAGDRIDTYFFNDPKQELDVPYKLPAAKVK